MLDCIKKAMPGFTEAWMWVSYTLIFIACIILFLFALRVVFSKENDIDEDKCEENYQHT